MSGDRDKGSILAFEQASASTWADMPVAGRPAVFLDRDGVLIDNRVDHVRMMDDVRVQPGAVDAVRRVRSCGFTPIVVSNQAVIGRGIVSLAQVESVHRYVLKIFADAGAPIDFSYLCPHAPAEECGCRKPAPGLLVHAAGRLRVDMTRSAMVGDALSDIEAGRAAGLPGVLVLTGRGDAEFRRATAEQLRGIPVVASVAQAVEHIVTTVAPISSEPLRRGDSAHGKTPEED